MHTGIKTIVLSRTVCYWAIIIKWKVLLEKYPLGQDFPGIRFHFSDSGGRAVGDLKQLFQPKKGRSHHLYNSTERTEVLALYGFSFRNILRGRNNQTKKIQL